MSMLQLFLQWRKYTHTYNLYVCIHTYVPLCTFASEWSNFLLCSWIASYREGRAQWAPEAMTEVGMNVKWLYKHSIRHALVPAPTGPILTLNTGRSVCSGSLAHIQKSRCFLASWEPTWAKNSYQNIYWIRCSARRQRCCFPVSLWVTQPHTEAQSHRQAATCLVWQPVAGRGSAVSHACFCSALSEPLD